MQEKIFLNSKSGKVCALYDRIGNDESIVLLTHGYLSDKNSRTCTVLSEKLNTVGISTISFDLYGHGESDGNIEQLTVTKAVGSVLAVYDFALSEGYKKVGLVGSSFSGGVALIAASKKPFSVLSLKCPVFDYKKLWDERFGKKGIEEWKKKGFVEPFGKKWNFEVYEDEAKYDMKKVAAMVKAPTLVVHGDKDSTVPLSQAKTLISTLKCEKKMVIVRGADHFFKTEKQFKIMSEVSFDWAYTHLKITT